MQLIRDFLTRLICAIDLSNLEGGQEQNESMRLEFGRIESCNLDIWKGGSRQLIDGLSILYEEKKLCITIVKALYHHCQSFVIVEAL